MKPSFRLRSWQAEDAESLAHHANNIHIAQYMTDQFPHPYTLAHARQFIDMALSFSPSRILAIEVDGVGAGGIGIHLQQDVMRKNGELGYWLSERYWGHGIITEAIREMVPYTFSHFDIIRIYARPYGNNIASQRVLEKAGFNLEAHIRGNIFKNGEYLDELIYAIRK
ncbi:MAG TPA: GNAT family protein [Ferruginibacter sp.]|nr:GNAT family protein [Ferruginibacter sp.]HRO18474.1 GNAT family protein [Ferruginibacter sp.]HRQ21698.1 GNAT family protein [Ferruginibacter sp.]